MSARDRYDFCNNNCALLPPYAATLRLSFSLTLNSVDSVYPTFVNNMGELLNLWSRLNSVHCTYMSEFLAELVTSKTKTSGLFRHLSCICSGSFLLTGELEEALPSLSVSTGVRMEPQVREVNFFCCCTIFMNMFRCGPRQG